MKHILLFTFLLVTSLSIAANVKGTVKDSANSDPIIGATVHLKNTSHAGFVDLDGSFVLKNVPAGNYILVVSFIGYVSKEKEITVSDLKDTHVKIKLTENISQLQEVVITSTVETSSETNSRKIEQTSDNVISVIGARAIQLLPDVTVGNLMQRVSGVSLVRNGNGDGQYAIIRGMDQRYNYTTINGIKVPSPDNKNRYIPMDIFPAELLERLEVAKALTPSMEGDAIGGAMNMVMKPAPTHMQVMASISGGYSSIMTNHPFTTFDVKDLNFKSPHEVLGNSYVSQPSDYYIKQLKYHTVKLPVSSNYALTMGNRFFKNKLGVVVAGSYQHNYRSHNGLFYVIAGQPNAGNVVSNDGIEQRDYSSIQGRTGIHVNVDYELSKKTKFTFYNIFAQLDETQHRIRNQVRTTDVGEYSNNDRSMFQRQRVNSSAFKIEQQIVKSLKVNLVLNTSVASNIIPDQVELSVKTKVDRNTMTGQLLDPGNFINGMTHRWYHNNDKDKGAYFNLIYSPISALEISSGGLIKTKNKTNFFTENTLSAYGPSSAGQAYTSIDNVDFIFKPASNAYADSTDPQNYVAEEMIKAGYLQAKITFFKKLQILGGMRAEFTSQSYTSAVAPTTVGKSGTVSYRDLLPSVHFKYELNKRINLRLSYFKGISRPSLFELVPAPNVGDYYTTMGNPYLKHSKSTNYDFRFEYFPSGEEQSQVGVFYKNIINPVEYSFVQIFNNSYYYAPANFGNAVNYGAELVLAKYYKKFGVVGNYTYTKSSITTTKRTIGANGVPGTQEATRPLQGQSKHIANLSLVFKHPKQGVDMRISWVYTGERINIVSAYYGLDYWQRPTSQLDFSGEKKLSKRLVVYVKATNLLNSSTIVEIRSALPDYFIGNPGQNRKDRVLVSNDVFGQSYLVGLRFKL